MRRALLALLLVALALLPLAAPARAQGFNQIGFNTCGAAVTLTTTTENVGCSSGPVTAPRPLINVCVIAYGEVTTGTGTTDLVVRIRRGTAITGTLVGEENELEVQAAAGSTESLFAMACEDRSAVATVDYSVTVDQVGASGNGSILWSAILVLVR